MKKLKSEKRKIIIKYADEQRGAGATFDEIARSLNYNGIKTITGEKWTTRNLFNFYNRHK